MNSDSFFTNNDDDNCRIVLSNERCEELKRIIANLYKELNINTVPINVFKMAYLLGITLIPYSSKSKKANEMALRESTDGFSVLKGGKWYVFYNDVNRNYGRLRNTIMHEITHIVSDHTEDSDLAEKEVNFFAKYALSPPPLIHKYRYMIKTVKDVCDCFEISYEAAKYAMAYYHKWVKYGGKYYTKYELQITRQVKILRHGGGRI